MKIEEIARVTHDANRAFCMAHLDFTQPLWDDAPQWQKDSAIAGIKFLKDNPTAQPKDSHQSWLDLKIKEGWIYGPVKNVEKKEHPCMVPYEEIPSYQQAKDHLFSSIVRASLPYIGN